MKVGIHGKSVASECGIDIERVRGDFPILNGGVGAGEELIYLDNAATTQKPLQVIEGVSDFEKTSYGTVRRGGYRLGEAATERYEGVRKKVANFLGVSDEREIIITSGATQSINLVARSYGEKFLKRGDEVVISSIEHHANIVPWQMICEELGVLLRVVPVNDRGELMMEEYEKLLSGKTKFVSVVYISNVLGTVNKVKEVIELGHSYGAKVMIDGAQSSGHRGVNVKELDCDFYVFSGHKIYGPSGIGVLYGKYELLEEMKPYVVGGDMIRRVSLEKTSYAGPPSRFEAGTPPISQMIGLGYAIDYIEGIGLEKIRVYERKLLDYGLEVMDGVRGLRLIGEAEERSGVISFLLEDIHPHDVVTILSEEGLALRGGHHCSQPTMDRFGVVGTTRVSVGVYNIMEEFDALGEGLEKVRKVFQKG